jgi:hypothetical protein
MLSGLFLAFAREGLEMVKLKGAICRKLWSKTNISDHCIAQTFGDKDEILLLISIEKIGINHRHQLFDFRDCESADQLQQVEDLYPVRSGHLSDLYRLALRHRTAFELSVDTFQTKRSLKIHASILHCN